MPEYGIESATVPGSVDGWQKLVDRFGKKKLDELLAPAIQIARTVSRYRMDRASLREGSRSAPQQ